MSVLREFNRRLQIRRKLRKLQGQYEKVYEAYQKNIEATTDYQVQSELEGNQHFECSQFEDAISRINSLEINRRASRCHLALSDLALPSGVDSHWIQGKFGSWFIHPKIYRQFVKEVEAAEHERTKRNLERRDFWLKLFTVIFAALAAIASSANLIRTW